MVTAPSTPDARTGALNLLVQCVGVQQGDRILLVEEKPQETLYCPSLATTLEAQAERLGAEPTRVAADHLVVRGGFPGDVAELMERSDHTVFLNRIGDHNRFTVLPGHCSKTICYTYDSASLASPFATVSHALLTQLRNRLEQEMRRARTWRITCPLGTDLEGAFCWPSVQGGTDDEFSLMLFPVSTFKPVPCDTASGRIQASRWLLPGGAAKVEPGIVAFDGVVGFEVASGAIVEVKGESASVRAVLDHYDIVSKTLDVHRDRVHSWHTGINPRTEFAGPIERDLARWNATSFASPRYLHFHTCGDTPPGEIALSVFNPTVRVDDRIYWENGEFAWLRRQDNRELIARYPGAECLLERAAEIGF